MAGVFLFNMNTAQSPYLKGSVSGTVKIDGNLARRDVALFRRSDFLRIRRTRSNPTTGAYKFSALDSTIKYFVIGFDEDTQNYNAVIKDRITPVVES